MLLTIATSLCASWSGGAEALYWKPTTCPIPYADGFTLLPGPVRTDQRFEITADADWGVRGWLGWQCGSLGLQVSFAYVRPTGHAEVSAGNFDRLDMIPLIDNPVSSVCADLALRYQELRVTLNRSVVHMEGLALEALGQVGWLDIFQNFSTEGPATGGGAPYLRMVSVKTATRGPLLGIGFCGCAPLWWGFHCSLGSVMTVGLFDLRILRHVVRRNVNNNVKDEPMRSFTGSPGFEANFRLSWRGCLHLGYEIRNYLDSGLVYNPSAESQESENNLTPRCNSVSFAGPTLGVSLCY